MSAYFTELRIRALDLPNDPGRLETHTVQMRCTVERYDLSYEKALLAAVAEKIARPPKPTGKVRKVFQVVDVRAMENSKVPRSVNDLFGTSPVSTIARPGWLPADQFIGVIRCLFITPNGRASVYMYAITQIVKVR